MATLRGTTHPPDGVHHMEQIWTDSTHRPNDGHPPLLPQPPSSHAIQHVLHPIFPPQLISVLHDPAHAYGHPCAQHGKLQL